MAGKETKIATVIIKVDLECSCCSKKIKSALCKLQSKQRFKTESIVFDEKKSTITVSGTFDPDCFIKEICCLAHKVIKDIAIKKPEPPKESDKSKSKPPPPPEVDVKISITPCCCQPCPQQSSKPCPQPCSLPCPQPCPKPCPEPCWAQPCPLPCCKPCLQPSQFGGYPCYKIVCEDEPSGGCSIM